MARLERITSDPGMFGGKPILRCMRISITLILSLLAPGETHTARNPAVGDTVSETDFDSPPPPYNAYLEQKVGVGNLHRKPADGGSVWQSGHGSRRFFATAVTTSGLGRREAGRF